MNYLSKKFTFVPGLMVAMALVLAACASAPATQAPAANPPAATNPSQAVASDNSSGSTPQSASSAGDGAGANQTSAKTANQNYRAAVNVGEVGDLGKVLVDGKGMTLYDSKNDTRKQSNCDAACQENWPPLLTEQIPAFGTGVNVGRIGTIAYDSTYEQVTYNDLPLYYFAKDEKPGDFFGQGIDGVWQVVKP